MTKFSTIVGSERFSKNNIFQKVLRLMSLTAVLWHHWILLVAYRCFYDDY